MLKWEPKVPLREGLAKTIGYFDELLRGRTSPGSVPEFAKLSS
jgi:hypothetical protein